MEQTLGTLMSQFRFVSSGQGTHFLSVRFLCCFGYSGSLCYNPALWVFRGNILQPMLFICGILGKTSCPIPSCPPYGQEWNCHISASNQNGALIFSSYERSLKTLSGKQPQFDWHCNIFLATMSANRSQNSTNGCFLHVIQVKIVFWVSIASLIDCQNKINGNIIPAVA